MCRYLHVSFSPSIGEVSSSNTPGIDGNSSLPLISSGRSTPEDDHGDGRSSCMSPRGCSPLSASLSALWDSTLLGSLIVTFVVLLSAITSSIGRSRASCTGLVTHCACMIDFPCFTFEVNQPHSPVYGVVCRSFCLVPPCATRVRRAPRSPHPDHV